MLQYQAYSMCDVDLAATQIVCLCIPRVQGIAAVKYTPNPHQTTNLLKI
jgi:hypothetical protein